MANDAFLSSRTLDQAFSSHAEVFLAQPKTDLYNLMWDPETPYKSKPHNSKMFKIRGEKIFEM